MIVLLLGGVMMMCLSSCCSSLMTAYANECDTDGTFGALAGDWYWDIVPSTGILGCTSDGGGGGDGGNYGPPSDDTSKDTTSSTTTGGGGSGDGGDKCKDSNYTYTGKIKKDGKWTCKSGYEQTGCSDKKLQCRKKKTGSSKCKPGTESNYDYRRRIEHKSKGWICPTGWESTGCGWSDGAELGEKQCRKRKKAGGSSSSSSNGGDTKLSSSSCIKLHAISSSGEDIKKITNRDPADYEICLDSGKNEYYTADLKPINWQDRITHVTVPKGITLAMWDHTSQGGRRTNDIVGPVTKKYLGEVSATDGTTGKLKYEASSLQFWKNNDSGGSSSGSSSGKAVRLYRDINYGGKEVGFDEVSVKDAGKYGLNNVISSMKIKKGYVLKGYDDKNFGGTPREWKEDTKWIGTTWNDKISSFKIVKK